MVRRVELIKNFVDGVDAAKAVLDGILCELLDMTTVLSADSRALTV
jgi:hypothetical protein